MLKRGSVLLVAILFTLCGMVTSAHGTYSLAFGTGAGNDYAWTVTVTNQTAVMSFYNNKVYQSSPTPDAVLNDAINLPNMALTHITVSGLMITAELVPVSGSQLTVTSDVLSGSVAAGTTVLAANVHQGGMLEIWNNFMAYSDPQDDLDVVSHVAGYSSVLDGFAAAESQHVDLDLSFNGANSIGLYNLLKDLNNGSVSGVLSGQITTDAVVPEPMTLSLVVTGIFGMIAGRRRK